MEIKEQQSPSVAGTFGRSNWPQWLARGKMGTLALIDQGLFAGSNFILNIVLARWLEPAQYGAFAVAYSLLLVLGAFHTAILTEPMTVFGAGKYSGRFSEYLGIVVSGHWVMTGLMATVLCASALVCAYAAGPEVAQALLGMALAFPFICLLWLLRRATYVLVRPQWSAVAGIVYLALVLTALYTYSRINRLSAPSALLIMGLSSAVISAGLIGRLGAQWAFGVKDRIFTNVLMDHWRYGRWASGTEALRSSQSVLFYGIVGSFLGLGAVAGLKAVGNIVAPIYQCYTAMASILVPRAARCSNEKGTGALATEAVQISIGLTVPALLYWIAVVSGGSGIMNGLYAGKYDEYAALISWIAAPAIFSAVAGGPNVTLRAGNRPDLLFYISLLSAGLAVSLVWIFATRFGSYGAAVGLSGSVLLGSVLTWAIWLRIGLRAQGHDELTAQSTAPEGQG